MNTQQAYNTWAAQYDTNQNKTRDLEAQALRTCLTGISFKSCLEIGCGTGKNTVWFVEKAKQVTAVDFSDEMLAKAKEKIFSDKVEFKQADITNNWTFANKLYDLVSFSLVLEHIDNLNDIFRKVSAVLQSGGHVYIGELHPFKQYNGTKARFDTDEGRHEVDCFTHNISDFVQASKKHGLILVDVNEFFDEGNRSEIPRIITIVLKKT